MDPVIFTKGNRVSITQFKNILLLFELIINETSLQLAKTLSSELLTICDSILENRQSKAQTKNPNEIQVNI
jgi:hypothetical protein